MQSLFKKIRSSRTTRIVGCSLALLLAGVSLASYSYKGTKSVARNTENKSSFVQASAKLSQAKVNESVGKLPLVFEPNQGQIAREVKYVARAKGYTVFLTGNETVLAIKGSKSGVLRMKMQNAADHPFRRQIIKGPPAQSKVLVTELRALLGTEKLPSGPA